MKLGHVAIDGSKIKANASKHKAMSYGRMEARARELDAEVEKWFAAAEATDAEEDRLYDCDQRGDELPDWVADKQKRAERIRAAKAELEGRLRLRRRQKRKPRLRLKRRAKTTSNLASLPRRPRPTRRRRRTSPIRKAAS